jgi:basic amino acid/polyamine antiporter, APA family
MASSTVAYGWSKYLLQLLGLFGIHLPAFLVSDPFSVSGAWCNLPAALICLAVTVILVIGIRESATFNAAMVALKLVVVLFVIAVGSAYVDPSHWQPFLPFGFGGVARGAGYVFFAYIGFDSVSTHAEEARNPQRDVPIGILTSLLLCTVLYVAVAAVLTGMIPYQQIDINAPLAAAFVHYGLSAAVFIISVGAVAGITSVLLVLMLSQPRVFFAMARDGLLPYSFFGTVHPRFRTPHKATILTGCVVALVAALFPIHALAEMVNIGTLFAFVVVCAAVWIMRHSNPHHRRPFRCPLVPLVPILGILFNGGLMFSLGWHNWARLTIWLAVGLAIYFGYSRFHSKLAAAPLST